MSIRSRKKGPVYGTASVPYDGKRTLEDMLVVGIGHMRGRPPPLKKDELVKYTFIDQDGLTLDQQIDHMQRMYEIENPVASQSAINSMRTKRLFQFHEEYANPGTRYYAVFTTPLKDRKTDLWELGITNNEYNVLFLYTSATGPRSTYRMVAIPKERYNDVQNKARLAYLKKRNAYASDQADAFLVPFLLAAFYSVYRGFS